MVDRAFVHIGLPKTATSYLQTILWGQREALRARGVVLPGSERRDHLWASRELRGEHARARPDREPPRRHATAWSRIVEELAGSEGTGLISHEFFAAASAEQATAMVAGLPTSEVHVVVTAREPLGLFTASWQESLKNGATARMPDYARQESASSSAIWNWRTLDLRLVLERWSAAVPPERTHVLVLDPDAAREDVWHRFAGVVGFSPSGLDVSGSFPNTSMGVAEAETLRRVNESLEGFDNAFDKGVFLRTYLADQRLVPRGGDRFWPEPDQVEDCRVRGERAIEHVRAAAYDVVGDLEHLRVPATPEPRRSTLSVTDAEVAEVAVGLVATMLGDVRDLRRHRGGPGEGGAGWRGRLRRRRGRAPG